MASTPADQGSRRYGIGAVAKMTGLTDHTIRVWERRYSAVVADRARNGRREYLESDVEKLMLLKRLTDDGIAISKIASHTISELRERTQSMRQMSASPDLRTLRAAVLGDLLPMQLSENPERIAPIVLVVGDSNRERFLSDLQRQTVDLLAMEVSVLDEDSVQELRDLQGKHGARAGVLVYRFAKSRDLARAEDAGVYALRAPADIDTLRATFVRASRDRGPSLSRATVADAGSAGFDIDGEIPPRLFTATQLAKLARISTTIDCECPQHLASLVNDLSAFEIYSGNCASRSVEDQALHRFLNVVTAQARRQFEEALQRVILEEGLEV